MVYIERKLGPLPAAASFRGSFSSGGTADGSFREASACGGLIGFRTAPGRFTSGSALDDLVVQCPVSDESSFAMRCACNGKFSLLPERPPRLASGREQKPHGEKSWRANLPLKGFTL